MSASTRAAARAASTCSSASGLAIDASFEEEAPPIQPMCICTPAGPTGWVYARKTAGHAVSGTLRWDGRSLDLAAIGARGHHDWSAGYMRRETFWNWGCLAGVVDGRVARHERVVRGQRDQLHRELFLARRPAAQARYRGLRLQSPRRHAAVAGRARTTAACISISSPRASTPNTSTPGSWPPTSTSSAAATAAGSRPRRASASASATCSATWRATMPSGKLLRET